MRRLAVVGCGAVLEGVHEQPLRRLMRKRDLRVVALVDPAPEARERAAVLFPGARFGAELEVALGSEADSLLVLSPPHSHAEVVVTALEAGLNVFCEKPLTDTTDGLDRIASAADGSRSARVAMVRRQFGTSHLLRRHKGELVDESDFKITYREGAPFTWPVQSPTPFFRGRGEAGVLIDVGSHVVDLMLWLFGVPTVSTYVDNATDTFAETDAELGLQLEGGEAHVRLSRRQPLPEGWLIESKLGQVWVPLGPGSTLFVRRPGARGWEQLRAEGGSWRSLFERGASPPSTSYDQAAYAQLDQFLFGDPALLATLDDGLTTTRVLLDAYALRS